jgi:L-rhamnose-H+ transport protein
MLTGFGIVLIAGLLQGSFLLPMALTRNWRWEHTWITFSALGMILFNWLIAAATTPSLVEGLRSAPANTITVLAVFGLGWGVGALLFGVGMERLGLALGYPIIMGLVACLGSLIPLAVFSPHQLLTAKGWLLLAGTALVVFGIALCSIGGLRKQPDAAQRAGQKREGAGRFASALVIGVLAGILSCLPNVGMAFGRPVVDALVARGVAPHAAPSVVFVLFFTAGGIVNCLYCLWLMRSRQGGDASYVTPEVARNIALAAVMAALWIGSFHLYGIGSSLLGTWGLVAGWPLFICISIGTGVLWGLWKGEWRGAPANARRARDLGILVLLLAVITISMSELI